MTLLEQATATFEGLPFTHTSTGPCAISGHFVTARRCLWFFRQSDTGRSCIADLLTNGCFFIAIEFTYWIYIANLLACPNIWGTFHITVFPFACLATKRPCACHLGFTIITNLCAIFFWTGHVCTRSAQTYLITHLCLATTKIITICCCANSCAYVWTTRSCVNNTNAESYCQNNYFHAFRMLPKTEHKKMPLEGWTIFMPPSAGLYILGFFAVNLSGGQPKMYWWLYCTEVNKSHEIVYIYAANTRSTHTVRNYFPPMTVYRFGVDPQWNSWHHVKPKNTGGGGTGKPPTKNITSKNIARKN